MSNKVVAAESIDAQPMLPSLDQDAQTVLWQGYPTQQVEKGFRDRWNDASLSGKIRSAFFPSLILISTAASIAAGISIEAQGVETRHLRDTQAIGTLALCREYVNSVPKEEPKIITVTLIPNDVQSNCGITEQVKAAKDRMLSSRYLVSRPEDSFTPKVVDAVPEIQLPRADAITAEMERLRADSKDSSIFSIIGNGAMYGVGGFFASIIFTLGTVMGINKINSKHKTTGPKESKTVSQR